MPWGPVLGCGVSESSMGVPGEGLLPPGGSKASPRGPQGRSPDPEPS